VLSKYYDRIGEGSHKRFTSSKVDEVDSKGLHKILYINCTELCNNHHPCTQAPYLQYLRLCPGYEIHTMELQACQSTKARMMQ